jgi:hypothetical protein
MIDAAGLCIYFAVACHADPGAWAVALITPIAALAVAVTVVTPRIEHCNGYSRN